MENNDGAMKMDDQMELPPGFRFHPTDEELITHYLSRKVLDCSFSAVAIGEVDMNKVEPWELPWRAKLGEKEWYFFCVRDKKYPTGLRTNRATAAGYWKATGKDKEIFRGKTLVGMKKTLVFYKGRAPRGEKSNWVCHEYRMEGKFSIENLPKSARNDWVISRVFQKTSGGKKVHISGLVRMNSEENIPPNSTLPPLLDPSPYTKPVELELELDVDLDLEPESGHVHCFSNTITASASLKIQDDFILPPSSNPLDSFPPPSSFSWGQLPPAQPGISFQFPGPVPLTDPSIIRTFLANYGQNTNPQGFRKDGGDIVSVSQETENSSVVSNVEMGKKTFDDQEEAGIGNQDLDCIWNY
ncbi:NAC domain-containing protein 79 [Sesamum indicum]|uniref:NAC domain-containing protein 79 n=1 Tax=Sesamum indicum TaxID=4182 RepID=A0A6I9SR55_SESIN|nr:NAC domain-containing protein 79 [Sesamum indicum]XP_011071689.1 NAC domain-containing protein 79 [Sesamum indicum]XP_020547905.1 NAC domain-containing protein 79 [Sesamum indicum]